MQTTDPKRIERNVSEEEKILKWRLSDSKRPLVFRKAVFFIRLADALLVLPNIDANPDPSKPYAIKQYVVYRSLRTRVFPIRMPSLSILNTLGLFFGILFGTALFLIHSIWLFGWRRTRRILVFLWLASCLEICLRAANGAGHGLGYNLMTYRLYLPLLQRPKMISILVVLTRLPIA